MLKAILGVVAVGAVGYGIGKCIENDFDCGKTIDDIFGLDDISVTVSSDDLKDIKEAFGSDVLFEPRVIEYKK